MMSTLLVASKISGMYVCGGNYGANVTPPWICVGGHIYSSEAEEHALDERSFVSS